MEVSKVCLTMFHNRIETSAGCAFTSAFSFSLNNTKRHKVNPISKKGRCCSGELYKLGLQADQ